MYTQKQMLIDEVRHLFPTVLAKNSWAKKYFEKEIPQHSDPIEEVSAERCWNLYAASRDNALGFLLLGEVSMRSKLALVQNFGLTSAYGHEDDEPWLSPWLGRDLKDPVEAKKYLGAIDPATLDAKKNAALQRLQGPGSILSDRLWTPLMNDAWLLGGVHKQQTFHHVTDGLGELKLIAALNKLTNPEMTKKLAFEATRARFGKAVQSAKAPIQARIDAAWRDWFVDNPHYLYESWGPRVLTRELIGLMSFGYRPEFTRQEMLFVSANPKAAEDATFTAYSSALERLGFHDGPDPSAKRSVLKALSKWLFGDATVLK